MGLYRDTGVVLRLHKLGEADRIVTVLTHHHGKVRATAKGVRRTTSRFGARLEPFGHVDLQLHTGRSLDIVTQVQTVDAFGGDLVGDYARYTAACAVLETADRLTPEENTPARELFLLLVGALRGLTQGRRDPHLVLDAFLLRAMALAGWAPAITDCARCGEAPDDVAGSPGYHRRFSVAAGGAVCDRCRPGGAVTPSGATWRLLEALRDGDWDVADAAGPAARRDAAGLVAAHLQWHLERQLRSLPLVERQAPPPAVPAARAAGSDDPDDPDDPVRPIGSGDGVPRAAPATAPASAPAAPPTAAGAG